MATRFLKLDLAKDARDFEPSALRLGVSFLDREGANYRALNKQLGLMIAEPEWNGEDVSFFVSDQTDARLHDIQCEPVTAKDLSSVKSLKQDFETLKLKLRENKADSRTADLFGAMARHFDETSAPMGGQSVGNHFFRYRDKGGTWRLVWCWGYQRRDKEPGDPRICTNPACRQLFLRRRSGDRDCPGCVRIRKRIPWLRVAMLLALVLLIGVGGFVATQWPGKGVVPSGNSASRLVVTPADWAAPAGSQMKYRVVRASDAGQEEDVTSDVVPVSEDPKVARFEQGTTTIHARSRGKTAVHFYLGDEEVHATVAVEAPRNPESIRLEPDTVTLGMGATADLILRGDFGDGQFVDLTEMAEWDPVAGSNVSCNAGRLEGMAPGEATVVARYRATPDDPYVSNETKITVVEEQYSKLEIVVRPSTIIEGSTAELEVSLVNSKGEKRSALNSSLLSVEVDDESVASVDGDLLRARQLGTGVVTASFGDLNATGEFTVKRDLSGRFVVTPKDLQLYVGELANLDVVSASAEAVHVISSSEEIVAVESGTTVIGRAPGKATLTITQEAREAKVQVEVEAARAEVACLRAAAIIGAGGSFGADSPCRTHPRRSAVRPVPRCGDLGEDSVGGGRRIGR